MQHPSGLKRSRKMAVTEYLFDAAKPEPGIPYGVPDAEDSQPGVEMQGRGAYLFLLGCGNWIFSANARMNPWVHLETHHR